MAQIYLLLENQTSINLNDSKDTMRQQLNILKLGLPPDFHMCCEEKYMWTPVLFEYKIQQLYQRCIIKRYQNSRRKNYDHTYESKGNKYQNIPKYYSQFSVIHKASNSKAYEVWKRPCLHTVCEAGHSFNCFLICQINSQGVLQTISSWNTQWRLLTCVRAQALRHCGYTFII